MQQEEPLESIPFLGDLSSLFFQFDALIKNQVALMALEKSLLVRETLLHPFNKELLRTLR